ncbi:hypothetical protein NB069_09255 [Leclercia adecarboxylata]|uniref:hypothetical protein n=1 Tax=Leclercia adecarboxylata TaxID=83655 RepID=UPI00202A2AE5|nr:hypothetical protein [Leclercia adecarboxylata]URO01033.1 hypothetical protein NB069_09255 [Leclercia adecarboxylata]
MAIVMLAALSAVLIVSGLIHFLKQLISTWCDPESPDAGKNTSGIAEGQLDVHP